MFSLKLRQFFSQGQSFKIKVGAESELRRYLRRNKTQRQLSWQRKMKLEWVMVFFAALISFNIVYNSYPETWFSHNLFMHTPNSLVMLAKAQADEELKQAQKQKE